MKSLFYFNFRQKPSLTSIFARHSAAVAFADVVSSDIVGYQTKETVSGFNFFTPTFKQVGSDGNTFGIQGVVLDPDTATSWSDSIQVLDEGGATAVTYFYVAAGEMNDGSNDMACWTEDGDSAADVDFTSGMSFIVDTSSESSITVAGQVLKGDITVDSVAGFNFVGNSSPVAFDIQRITLDETNATSWSDSIQILDEGGATLVTYFYVAAGEMNDGSNESACWTEDGDAPAVFSVEPGLGILVDTANEGVTITIPMAM